MAESANRRDEQGYLVGWPCLSARAPAISDLATGTCLGRTMARTGVPDARRPCPRREGVAFARRRVGVSCKPSWAHELVAKRANADRQRVGSTLSPNFVVGRECPWARPLHDRRGACDCDGVSGFYFAFDHRCGPRDLPHRRRTSDTPSETGARFRRRPRGSH